MVYRCIVPGCGHYQKKCDDEYAFYCIPKDPALRTKWLDILKIDQATVGAGSRICGRHFLPGNEKCRRLPADAVPCMVLESKGTVADSSIGGNDVAAARSLRKSEKRVIVLDSPEGRPQRRRGILHSPANVYLSQASSSKSGPSQPDSSYSLGSSISEAILEKFFVDNDPNKPKKNYLAKDEGRNFVVNEKQLRLLLRYCPQCGTKCGDAYANSYGVDAEFSIDCYNCGELVDWWTQPELPSCQLKKGNLDATAAVLLAGKTYTDLEKISTNLNMNIMSKSTFYNYASRYLYPLVDNSFQERQQKLLEEIQWQQVIDDKAALTLAIDCRFSRPGFTATYGVTSAMCSESKKIIATAVKAKTDEDVGSSAAMEVEGTRQVLKAIMDPYSEDDDQPLALILDQERAISTSTEEETDINEEEPNFFIPAPPQSTQVIPLHVRAIVTDENQSVIAMIRQDLTEIERHDADPWHLRKSIMKRIRNAGKKRNNRIIQHWTRSIQTWIWTSMKECNGDADLLVELWRSILHHISGQHAWDDDDTYKTYKRCLHADFSHVDYAYLDRDSPAFRALVDIVEDKKIHARLRRCAMFVQTSWLESFHSLLCKYLPKDLRFDGTSYMARTKMAILDWNENIGRPYKKDKNGGDVVVFSHPAAVGEWRARRMRVDRTSCWRDDIMRDLSDNVAASWSAGIVVRHRFTLPLFRTIVSTCEPLERVETAANLYRN